MNYDPMKLFCQNCNHKSYICKLTVTLSFTIDIPDKA